MYLCASISAAICYELLTALVLGSHRVAWGYWLRVVGIRPVEARGPQAGGGGVGCRRNRWYKGGGLPKLGVHRRP